MQHKRTILITEDEQIVFRYDVKIRGKDFIEYDLFNALNDMDKSGRINMKKVFNLLKVKYGMTLEDALDFYKEAFLNQPNWKILPSKEE